MPPMPDSMYKGPIFLRLDAFYRARANRILMLEQLLAPASTADLANVKGRRLD